MKKIRNLVLFVVVPLLAELFGLYRLAGSRSFQLFGTIVPRVETAERVIALTFDDGPAATTGELLDILRRHNVRATFFVTGGELHDNMALGRRMVTEGHALGNHSYSHPRFILKSPAFIAREIETTDRLIRAAGFTGEIFFRPPGCKKLLLLPWYLSRRNRITVTWDQEPDSRAEIRHDPRRMTAHLLAHVRPGSIILLHGSYPGRRPTLAALPTIITGLKKAGYRFLVVGELLRLRKHRA